MPGLDGRSVVLLLMAAAGRINDSQVHKTCLVY